MASSVFSAAHAHLVRIITEARKASGLTQVDLSQKLGRSQTYVSNIERGQRRIDVLEFYEWSVALGRDPVDLFAMFSRELGKS